MIKLVIKELENIIFLRIYEIIKEYVTKKKLDDDR